MSVVRPSVATLILLAMVLATGGCGWLGSVGQPEGGYLLLPEDGPERLNPGILYVEFEETGGAADDGSRQVAGRLHRALRDQSTEPEGAVIVTGTFDGTVDGENILINQDEWLLLGGPLQAGIEYQGTIDGDTLELSQNIQGSLTTWSGEEATLEDFGEAADELAE